MKDNIFISFSNKDKEIVLIFSKLIKQITGNQINILYSTNIDGESGYVDEGDRVKTLLNNIKNSKVLIAFITDNSNDCPWLLYESGYAAALKDTILVPVKFMVKNNKILDPFRYRQICSISEINEINSFLQRLLAEFDIEYKEEQHKDMVSRCFEEMYRKYISLEKTLQRIDKSDCVVELEKKVEDLLNYVHCNLCKIKSGYEIEVRYEIDNRSRTEHIMINSELTVSDVLDEIYFLLYDKVFPYTYMTSWVLRELKTNKYALISSVQDWIPANIIFKPGTIWEVVFQEDENFLNDILRETSYY